MLDKWRKEYLQNARRQRYWSTLAMKDSRYSKAQAKRLCKRSPISAKDFMREARVDLYWAKKRLKWAKQYENKAKSLKNKKRRRK